MKTSLLSCFIISLFFQPAGAALILAPVLLRSLRREIFRAALQQKEKEMLSNANVQPMLPVNDLKKAEKFYGGTLGLKKLHEEPGTAVTYKSGNGTLNVYRSEFAGTNKGTAALWEVDDVEGTVKQLKAKGVTFEHYDDLPGLTRDGDIHRAGDFRVAWWKDPSGNILSIQNRTSGSKNQS
jgi:catechol 2,3-dioxygenase-like lactoylglutathione lyase family enzyme